MSGTGDGRAGGVRGKMRLCGTATPLRAARDACPMEGVPAAVPFVTTTATLPVVTCQRFNAQCVSLCGENTLTAATPRVCAARSDSKLSHTQTQGRGTAHSALSRRRYTTTTREQQTQAVITAGGGRRRRCGGKSGQIPAQCLTWASALLFRPALVRWDFRTTLIFGHVGVGS